MAHFCFLLVLSLTLLQHSLGQLTSDFYEESCPYFVNIVRGVVKEAIGKEPRMGASLIRLHFHDCFVQGCDASCLLDDTSSILGEKTAIPNNSSLRGFELIDLAKYKAEQVCPGVVSCADILTLAAREAVSLLGGPYWELEFGRRDSTTASFDLANQDIPAPDSTLDQLVTQFSKKGLSLYDMVALSGSHTIGEARCAVYRNRLYNFLGSGAPDPTIDTYYLASLQKLCPNTSSSDSTLAPLDPGSPETFDNWYYMDLRAGRGLFHSDQILESSNGFTRYLVHLYSVHENIFFDDYVESMVKMSKIGVLTGDQGEIRKSCRSVNGD